MSSCSCLPFFSLLFFLFKYAWCKNGSNDPCQVTSSYRKVGFLLDDDEVPGAIVQKWSKFDVSRNLREDFASKKSMLWYTVCHQLSVFLLFYHVFLSFLKHRCPFEMDTQTRCIWRRIVLLKTHAGPISGIHVPKKLSSFKNSKRNSPLTRMFFFLSNSLRLQEAALIADVQIQDCLIVGASQGGHGQLGSAGPSSELIPWLDSHITRDSLVQLDKWHP